MKLLAFGGFAVVAGGLLYLFVDQKPADVYDMPVSQAYGLLMNVKYGPLTEGEKAVELERATNGNGRDKVIWETRGSWVHRSCEMALAPFEGNANRTHVTVTCEGGGAGEGAAAGMAHNMHRNSVIERVDATLTGRPYDNQRIGQTSSRWPGDGVDGSLGTAIGGAMKMERDMARMQAEMDERSQWSDSESSSGDYADSTAE